MIVTIVTAVKNCEKTILDTINSVNSQTYKNIQHIIVDSMSDDKTLELVNENVNSLAVVISEPDDGIYDGINKGILKSSGDIIGILNADDFYIDNNVIEDVVNEFINKDVNILYADLDYVGREKQHRIYRRWISGPFDIAKLSLGWMPPHPTIFFKKSLIKDFGIFNLEYKISSDYDFILRYFSSANIRIGYLSRTIIKMRVGGISNRSIMTILEKSLEDYRIIKRNHVGGCITLFLKNLRKIPQIFKR
jgi:glycosyltransferase